MVCIPFIDMIKETAERFQERFPKAKTVGLIASIGTNRSGVYSRSLSVAGVEVLLPDETDQQRIESAINQVKAGVHNRNTTETFQSIGQKLMDHGAEAVILGCTEIPLAFDADGVTYPTLNPTKILAEAAVNWALEKSPQIRNRGF
jgi:aspartate racemase